MKGGALLDGACLAAGAEEVMPGIHGLPAVINHPSEVSLIRQAHLQASDIPLASNHVFGSMSMGADHSRHAVDPQCAVYGTDDLFVADTSVFPSSPGVNPMLTAMALAERLGAHLTDPY